MGETTIAWTNFSFNPWIGCTKVGPGCDHCYAESWNKRFASDGSAPNWGPGAPRRRTRPQNWGRVRKWNREAEGSDRPVWVFAASLADIFDNEADPQDFADFWSLVRECQNLQFQIVTKRIGNVVKMLPTETLRGVCNYGIIATVVTQDECDRDLPKLYDTKHLCDVPWIGLSIEPQLELVIPDTRFPLDWVITGGESYQRNQPARPYDPEWARALIYEGEEYGYRVFVKQMGSNPIGMRLRDGAGANPDEWPEDLRVRQYPNIAGLAS